jgi:7,8-dihydropterin-6-yl-methyl-4-(beta-D-ribofuranosyl)aminobenzene 5'-phosphate synthase
MKIVTLIENLVYQADLLAEHGLSFYIDTGTRKLLFDTGQTSAFMSNAQVLGIDVKEIDAVVISHGHYDHTGGLSAFLQVNKKAIVYAKPEMFAEKFQGIKRYVGVPANLKIPPQRVFYIDKITELDEGVFIMPDITIKYPVDTSFCDFFIKKENAFNEDIFNDELFLTIIRDNKLSVISSCSHHGITNIVRESISHFNLPVFLILGGFHLRNCSSEQYASIKTYLKQIEPEQAGVCHCTGVEKFAELKNDLSCRVFYNMTANVIQI